MGDPAQGRLDAAKDDRHVLIGLAATLGVDCRGVVRPFVRRAVWRVGIIGTDLAVGGITVDHRVHVPGGNAEIQVGPTQGSEWIDRAPVRLSYDTDPEALGLQQPPDQRHAEAGVVDVGIAGDQNDVAGVPAEYGHFLLRHGQKGCDAEAFGPIGLMGG